MSAPFKKFVIHAEDVNTFKVYVQGNYVSKPSDEELAKSSIERRNFIEEAIEEKLKKERH